MVKLAISLALLVTACSPYGGGAFSCERDDQCTGGPNGKCEDNHFCSFTDTTCGSGRRYGGLSGPLSNACVGDMIDAGITDDVPMIDGPTSDSPACYGTGFGRVCFATAPTMQLTINTQSINTDTSPLCSQSASLAATACVVATADVSVTGSLTATGLKPLVLLGANSVTISGSIDVASHRLPNAQIGAGSVPITDTTNCDPGTAGGNNSGGAGGSFGGAGMLGGNAGSEAVGATKPAALRGGCAGQDGKSGTPGVKGLGGGAIYLVAGTSITINNGGVINASGAAGTQGITNNAGGGGGGSGGLIAFDAPTVTNNGIVFANGGGGAEGSGGSTPGLPGNEPTGIAAAPVADGGSSGGRGGSGGAQGSAATTGGNAGGSGGGGGGGGVGIIKLFQATSLGGSGAISPNPS